MTRQIAAIFVFYYFIFKNILFLTFF